MSTAAAKRYLYSHFNSTSSSTSTLHLNSSSSPNSTVPSSPSSVISSPIGRQAAAAAAAAAVSTHLLTNNDICGSVSQHSTSSSVDPLVTIISSASSSSAPSSVITSDHQCTTSHTALITSAPVKGEQGLQLQLSVPKREHEHASESAIDLVKSASLPSHRHVPVIASTAGYAAVIGNSSSSSSNQQITSLSSTVQLEATQQDIGGRVPVLDSAKDHHHQQHSSTAAAAAEVHQPSSTAATPHLCLPVSTVASSDNSASDIDCASRQNVTVCDTNFVPASSTVLPSSTSSSSSSAATCVPSTSATSSSDHHSESSDYGSASTGSAKSSSIKDRESPFSSPDEGIEMEEVEVLFKQSTSNNASLPKDFLLKRISNDLQYASHLSLKRRRKENVHLQEILAASSTTHKDLVTICNKNELFAHEPTTGDKGAVDGVVDSSMLKQNANGYRRTLYQCTWPACSYTCMACHLIEQHVRVEHLGRSEANPIDNEDSDREEEFYYSEMEIEEQQQQQQQQHPNLQHSQAKESSPPPAHSAFITSSSSPSSSLSSSSSSSSSSAVSSAISPLSPVAPPSPPLSLTVASVVVSPTTAAAVVATNSSTAAVADLVNSSSVASRLLSSTASPSLPPLQHQLPVIYRPSPLVASQIAASAASDVSSHYRMINSSAMADSMAMLVDSSSNSSKFTDVSSMPIDLSPKSKLVMSAAVPAVVDHSGHASTVDSAISSTSTVSTTTAKSVYPFTSPLLLVAPATTTNPITPSTPAVGVTPISPPSVASSVFGLNGHHHHHHHHLYPSVHRPLAELTAASLLQQKFFHTFNSFKSQSSTSPSSLSSHSSHSSGSSAYFSSSPTSSTKSWSLDELMMNVNARAAVAAAAASEASKASQMTGQLSPTNVGVSHLHSNHHQSMANGSSSSSSSHSSVVTHSVSHLLSHDSKPSSNNNSHYSDQNGVLVLNNKSNVIKFGGVSQSISAASAAVSPSTAMSMTAASAAMNNKPLNLHNKGYPDIKPILAAVSSSNGGHGSSSGAILPLPLSSALAAAAVNAVKQSTAAAAAAAASAAASNALSNGSSVPTVPRRRGRPPGSTNKKKKLQQQLQQQQQLIMSLMPTANGLGSHLVGNPFMTSAAGLLGAATSADPHSHGHHGLSHLGCSPSAFVAAFSAMQSAQGAVAAIGLKSSSGSGSGRKPRGEARKCRKVYGMDNRAMWCISCKWKKKCQRYSD